MKKICIIFMLLSAILYACNSARRTSDLKLPAEKYTAYPLGYSHKIIGDSLVVSLNNVLECPVRVVLNDTSLNKKFERNGFVVLNPKEKKTVSVFLNGVKKYNSEIRYMLGRPAEHPKIVQLSLPFPKGKKYTVIQGYSGNFSHNEGISRYALDFSLKIGDTVCAAESGYVVGLVEKYQNSGRDSSWRDYANFITIYNPETGLFTEYVHLKHNGALAAIGNFVNAGQPIALSGMTGWTTVPHLHFVAYFRNKGWVSEPVKAAFAEGYRGEDLQEGDTVKKI